MTARTVSPDGATIEPTQVRRPWLATARTIIANAVAVVLVIVVIVPPILEAILAEESLPEGLRVILLGIGAGVAAVAGIVTRIMAIPQVNEWLRRIGVGVPPVAVLDAGLDPMKVTDRGAVLSTDRHTPNVDAVVVAPVPADTIPDGDDLV